MNKPNNKRNIKNQKIINKKDKEVKLTQEPKQIKTNEELKSDNTKKLSSIDLAQHVLILAESCDWIGILKLGSSNIQLTENSPLGLLRKS